MNLDQAVGGVGVGEYGIRADVFTSYGKGAADGVGRELVPEGADARVRQVAIVEVGVRQVEAYIHHAHHHTVAGNGLMGGGGLVDGQGIDDGGGGVEQLAG